MSVALTRDEAVAKCRSWTPDGLVLYYDWVQRAAGFTLPDHLYPVVLAICDHRIKKLLLVIGPGSGKSVLLSQIAPSALLGRDPTQNVLCVSGAENLAQGFQDVVMSIVEYSEAFRACFPNVKPDKAAGWSSTRGMFLTGRQPTSPDAGYWAAGVESTAITGKHGTFLMWDDLHDEKNSSTPEQCAQIVRKYVMQLSGRADPRGAREMLAGRRWHENDLYGALQHNGDWVCMTLPAERPDSKLLWYDVTVPAGIECVFTDGLCMSPDGDYTLAIDIPSDSLRTKVEERPGGVLLRHIEWPYGVDPKGQGFYWPASEQKRREYFSNKRLLPAETEAVYGCNPGARTGSVFLKSDFERRYEALPNQDMGVHDQAVAEMCRGGAMVVQGWDTAFSAESSSDYTVCVTALLTPCGHYHRGEDEEKFGPCEQHYDIRVLDVWREQVPLAGVEQAIRAQYLKWQPAWVVIEKKAYGVAAIENLANSGIPIEPVTPGPLEGKRARAVEGVGAGSAQGWCRQWRVELPLEAEWLKDFLAELEGFTGQKGRTDDQVDAFVHLVRWAILNGGGVSLPAGWETAAKVDTAMGLQRPPNPHAAMAGLIHDPASVYSWASMGADVQDPFDGTCGRCRNFVGTVRGRHLLAEEKARGLPRDWCLLHTRPTIALASCEDHQEPNDDSGISAMPWEHTR